MYPTFKSEVRRQFLTLAQIQSNMLINSNDADIVKTSLQAIVTSETAHRLEPTSDRLLTSP